MTEAPFLVECHPVPPSSAGERLDLFAAREFEHIASRKSAQKLAKRELLLVNGDPAAPNHRLQPGESVGLRPDNRPVEPIYNLPVAVIYEDSWLAVVNKPAGIPVSGNYVRTLQRALPASLTPSSLPDALPCPRPVHRLDSPTQGLLLVAKNARAQVALGHQFEEKAIRKRYRAICLGRLEGEGILTDPIDGRSATTRYQAVIHTPSVTTEWVTTVDLYPQTGRTHQLRRHLADLGHPILGDKQYTDGKVLRGKGLFLAALALAFHHPEDHRPLHVELPEPAKFASLRNREQRRWNVLKPEQ
ncbi:MAG: RluA family pseudouridine synthase [Victivallales bacterium]|nr:RluA family pseudouridine synthase [Victivallales bacterium]